jgi:hypothetical protein
LNAYKYTLQLIYAVKWERLTGHCLGLTIDYKVGPASLYATFIISLKDSGVHFISADRLDASTLTIGIFAVGKNR